MSQVVFGLDLSLTSTGWSCGDDRGTVSFPKLRSEQRLVAVRDCLHDLIVEKFAKPVVVIEGYSFGSRNSQSHSIGELGGVIKVMLYENDIRFVIVPPTVRAKFATGKGNASKHEVVSAVSARTGIVWSGKGSDDMCDAFVLEEMGRVYFGAGRFDWPSSHLDALEKINWEEQE
jgi:Holliday junction resolvasome RuvABC endonuclease subunit